MAKKTNPTPAKTATKKPVTMAERVTLERVFEATTRIHVQHTKALNEIKRMVENFEIRIMQRMDSRIDATTGRLLKDVLDMRNAIITETNAIDETVDRIERLLATPQDVTGSPADIPEQGVEPGDYTDASKEVADKLTAMGYEWYDDDRYLLRFIEWGRHMCHKGMMVNKDGKGHAHYPQAEFLSRASVTAKAIGLVAKEEEPWKPEVGELAKVTGPNCVGGSDIHPIGTVHPVKEVDGMVCIQSSWGQIWYYLTSIGKPTPEEVAKYHADKEAAKPIGPYVTRVMCDGYEWRVICGMDQLKRYRIHRIEGEFEYCVSVQRHEFTVIDP